MAMMCLPLTVYGICVTVSQQHGAVDPQPFPLLPRKPRMPSLAVLISLVLFATSGFVVAQITGPDCNLSWEWTFNTLGQGPCIVAAYMMGTCNDSVFTIDKLKPGNSYTAHGSIGDCQCNIVTYNLLSVCDACQGVYWRTWSDYSFNCTNDEGLSSSTFPNAVPPGTRVPQWALIDNTLEDNWNPIEAEIAGVTPEIEPDSFISTPASGADTPAPSDPPLEDISPVSFDSESGPNTGAIAGGTRSQVPFTMVDGVVPPMSQDHPPLSGDKAYVPKTPVAPMKFYDPNDPGTFPQYQRVPTSAQDVYDRAGLKDKGPDGTTPNKVQAAPTPGYHGLPMV
ncbi:hypothetical protein H4582DRAFT_1045539 [Lactarius indigo]|nr:hypothetical protein H4582DRAFT_1045539 [Lactarius indigo]